MAELALGVLGVVPLIGGAIKTYRCIASKLKSFKKCAKEIGRIQHRIKIQRLVFKNECQIILQLVVGDDALASAMISDVEHERWDDVDLDGAFQDYLKDSFETFLDVVREIRKSLEEFNRHLDCFDILTGLQEEGEKMKETIERLKGRVKFSYKISDYDADIQNLTSHNNELKGLREQLNELRNRSSSFTKKKKMQNLQGMSEIRRLQRASKALHGALVETWDCGQPGHTAHIVKLFVEADHCNDDIKMQLAIVCHFQASSQLHSRLISLEVRSQALDSAKQPTACVVLSTPTNSGTTGPRKRRKVVRFEDDSVLLSGISSSCSSTACIQQSISDNLQLSKDICQVLTQHSPQSFTTLGSTCLGHLDSSPKEGYRHSFYPAQNEAFASEPENNIIRMDEMVEFLADNSFSLVHKFKIARLLATTLLKFHSTPWLRDCWRLRDLAFFRNDGQAIPESLRTLHVGSEVIGQGLGSMEGIIAKPAEGSLSEASEDELLFCGISNIALHSLGVALLQISTDIKLEPGDVLTVRKMALKASSLGPRYRDIIQKCLRCDFGYGSDLTKPRLQEAIYDGVIEELESIISKLDIDSD